MAKTDFKTVDEYISTFPKDIQQRLERVRSIIHDAVPDAKEIISYQIPCFNLNGPILYFSAFTSHISIAAPPPTIEVFKDKLTKYKTSKSVFQISFESPIPEELITEMAKWREKENSKSKK